MSSLFPSPHIFCLTWALAAVASAVSLSAAAPTAVPTFHAVGIYWKTEGGSEKNRCQVDYRPKGESKWSEALPLWYDANDHPGVKEHSREYRGSIVDLEPGTNYEVRLKLSATGEEQILSFATWSEKFKIKARHAVGPGISRAALHITEGGSAADGYVLYEGTPGQTIIDGGKTLLSAVEIQASYVIVRGVTVRNPARHGMVLGDVNNVIIEDCEISGWGRNKRSGASRFGENYDAGIYSEAAHLHTIIVQRCKIHDPTSAANSWGFLGHPDVKENGHPQGPQGIVFGEGGGNYVIRYNEIYSDDAHGFNDGIGAWENRSFVGFPNRDSDIYCNKIANAWDDAIEAEGADMNVRIWSNYIDHTFVVFGLASTSLGPLYVFRNESGLTRRDPPDAIDPRGTYPAGGAFFKLGAPVPLAQYAKGKVYLFHNTIGEPTNDGKRAGAAHGVFVTAKNLVVENVTSRNNLLDVRSAKDTSVYDPQATSQLEDFDYDQLTGTVEGPAGAETHAVRGAPKFEDGKAASSLELTSPGAGAALALPNFNTQFSKPDIGAEQRGVAKLEFGVQADWNHYLRARAGAR